MTQPLSDSASHRPRNRPQYVSRGGDKLGAALDHFKVDVAGCVCADLGSHIGGFVDCLLQRGAARVYAVDTCYGTLAWKLRRDTRVEVLERTNAMHVSLPEPVDLVTIDVGWTPQIKILPNVERLVKASGGLPAPAPAACPTTNSVEPVAHGPGQVLTLIKPHYEAQRIASMRTQNEPCATPKSPALEEFTLVRGVLPDDVADVVVDAVLHEIAGMGWTVCSSVESSIRGHAGNREVFALLALA